MSELTLQELIAKAHAIESGKERASEVKPRFTLERAHIDELWRRMAAIYGHKWVSNYGEVDEDDTWLMGLQGLEPAELALGIRSVISSGQDWPPSLPQFRLLCRPPPDGRPIAFAGYPEWPKPTPEQLASITKSIAECRRSLKIARREIRKEQREKKRGTRTIRK